MKTMKLIAKLAVAVTTLVVSVAALTTSAPLALALSPLCTVVCCYTIRK